MKPTTYLAAALVLASCASTYTANTFAHRTFAMATELAPQYGGTQTLHFSQNTAEYKTGDIMTSATYRVEGHTILLTDRQTGRVYTFSILSAGRLRDAHGNIYTAQ